MRPNLCLNKLHARANELSKILISLTYPPYKLFMHNNAIYLIICLYITVIKINLIEIILLIYIREVAAASEYELILHFNLELLEIKFDSTSQTTCAVGAKCIYKILTFIKPCLSATHKIIMYTLREEQRRTTSPCLIEVGTHTYTCKLT